MCFDVSMSGAEQERTPGTLVTFHAHPDDEAILTGGTIARAADEGHRVVVVFATRGELGENLDGVERTPGALGTHRIAESEHAATLLGAARVAFLDFHDSGMAGEATNQAPGSFVAARRGTEAAAASASPRCCVRSRRRS